MGIRHLPGSLQAELLFRDSMCNHEEQVKLRQTRAVVMLFRTTRKIARQGRSGPTRESTVWLRSPVRLTTAKDSIQPATEGRSTSKSAVCGGGNASLSG